MSAAVGNLSTACWPQRYAATNLRKILIHGARSAVLRIKRDRAPIGAWLDALDLRAHKDVVVVVTANKLARIAWAVLLPAPDNDPTHTLRLRDLPLA